MKITANNKTLSWLLLVILLLLSFFISWFMHQQALRFARAAFDTQVDDLVQALRLHMNDHEQLLLGTKGLYEASQSVEREEFHQYVSSLEVLQKYPGVQILGFSKWIKPEELPGVVAQVRDEGFPKFNLRPQGKRDFYTMIIYAEPFFGKNLIAFGYDMFSEPTRRKAMSAAVETNQARLSAKVILVQEDQREPQAGTLLYLPIFKKSVPLATPQERWDALEGFVYAAFRMGDLTRGVLHQKRSTLRFTLYGGETADQTQILFNSHDTSDQAFAPAYTKNYSLQVFGQPWLLKASSDPLFEQKHLSHMPFIALILGIFISVLLSVMFYVLANQRQRAVLLAESMTEDARAKNVQLKNSQARFELALESSSMGVWSLDPVTKKMQWDAAMYRLLGINYESLAATYENFVVQIHQDDRIRVTEEIARAIEGRKGYDIEFRVVRADHSVHFLASRAKIIYDGETGVSMLGTCWDITERKQLDKVKNEFVSTVSHELRTPLTAITGALGLAVSGALCELPEKAKQVLDIAYRNSQRLKLLINDLLDMDKLLAGKLEFHCEPQTLMPLIERAVMENKAYADQMQVRLVIEPSEIAPRVEVEDIRFLQVMANYLSNAAKFSKPHSDVTISLEDIDGYARVSVTDKGAGLSDESKSHIFEKFYQADSSDTRAKGGTGLGLAITKELVERMNGRVGFISDLGVGSTFYAEFPILK